jgi:hypothetical protein
LLARLLLESGTQLAQQTAQNPKKTNPSDRFTVTRPSVRKITNTDEEIAIQVY